MHKLIFQYKDILFYKLLERQLSDCRSVLDVGCGSNSPLLNIGNRRKINMIGIDLHPRSIRESKRKKIHNNYVLGNITKLRSFFKPNSFDAVVAFDIIEHLDKKDALKVLKNMNAIAKKKIIILTPNGFQEQGEVDGNFFQIHKSGWSAGEFRELGYKVYGLRGLKYIRGQYATIKYKPWILWGMLAFISEFLLLYFPGASYDIFAVKELDI